MHKALLIGAAVAALAFSTTAGAFGFLGADKDSNLKQIAADKISELTGVNVEANDVSFVGKPRHGVTHVSWTVSSPQGTFRCDSDDMMRNPSCAAMHDTTEHVAQR